MIKFFLSLGFISIYLNMYAQIDSIELNGFYHIHDFDIKNNLYKLSHLTSDSIVEADSIIFNAQKYLENLKFSKKKLRFEDSVELVISSRTLKHYGEKSVYNKDNSFMRFIWFKDDIQKIVGIDLDEKNNFRQSLYLKIGNGKFNRKGDLILKQEISLSKKKYKKLAKKIKIHNIDFSDLYCGVENDIEFTIPNLIIEKTNKNTNHILMLNNCKLYKGKKYRWVLRFFKSVEKLAKRS